MEEIKSGSKSEFALSDDGILIFGNRLCVSNDGNFRRELLEEAHFSILIVHLGRKKMSKYLKKNNWWSSTKRDIA